MARFIYARVILRVLSVVILRVLSVTKVDPGKATEVRKAKMRGMAIPWIMNQTVGIVVRGWMKRMT